MGEMFPHEDDDLGGVIWDAEGYVSPDEVIERARAIEPGWQVRGNRTYAENVERADAMLRRGNTDKAQSQGSEGTI